MRLIQFTHNYVYLLMASLSAGVGGYSLSFFLYYYLPFFDISWTFFPFFFPLSSCLFALFLVVLLAASYLILFHFDLCVVISVYRLLLFFVEYHFWMLCFSFLYFSPLFPFYFTIGRTCRWVPWLTSSVSFSDGWLRLRDTRSIPPSLVQQSVSSSACPARQDTYMPWMVTCCALCLIFFFYFIIVIFSHHFNLFCP